MTDPLARIRSLATLLPEVTERPNQDLPSFFVAERQFAQYRESCDGVDGPVVCVRVADAGEQAALLAAAPDVYAAAPCLDTIGWIAIRLAGEPDWVLVEDRIAQSWELAAPRRLLEAGGR